MAFINIHKIGFYILNFRIEGVKKETWTCVREDNRDLTNEWKVIKEKEGVKHAFVTNTEELRNVDSENIENLLGLYINSPFLLQNYSYE